MSASEGVHSLSALSGEAPCSVPLLENFLSAGLSGYGPQCGWTEGTWPAPSAGRSQEREGNITMGKPGKQAAAPLSPASPRLATVQITLPVQIREALQRILREEGLTLQTYFAAQAADKLATAVSRAPSQETRALQQVSSPRRYQTRQTRHPDPAGSPSALAPGQTYQMPTGRYIHWCTVCRNLWRSHEANPLHCGHRTCHARHWRTGSCQTS